MNPPRKCTAIKVLFCLALLGFSELALAAVAGTVTRLSGPLLDRKPDGKVKILALKSEVEEGDTLVSEANTYAQIKLVDNGEITLRPSSTFTIESFSYDTAKPDGDNAAFNLVKGGLRSVTGALGKRNKEKFALKTPTATIGIRGTTFIAEYVPPSDQAVAAMQAYVQASTASLDGALLPAVPLQLAQNAPSPSPSTARAPGLYVQVIDGAINLTNKGGTTNFSAGQFGYTASPVQPPVVIPKNPGIQFTPPPAFSQSTGPSSSGAPKAAAVDCEVR